MPVSGLRHQGCVARLLISAINTRAINGIFLGNVTDGYRNNVHDDLILGR